MREETRARRRAEIEAAAYDLLGERGYAATSMLAIATRANASNETLYRWYGSKQGLFKSLVDANAAEIRDLLACEPQGDNRALPVLEKLGPLILSMLLGERAVALNRAAAADPSGELGKAIAEGGRQKHLPLITTWFEQAVREGDLSNGASAGEMAETYLALLIGDHQVRRIIQVRNEPTRKWCASHAKKAFAHLLKLYGTER